jgi:hypothetical protein
MDKMNKADLLTRTRSLSIHEMSDLMYEADKRFYTHKPVDIETFIHDDHFLGRIYGENIFPLWERLLKELYPTPFYSDYYEVILSCAIGAGKSSVSSISLCYEIYKLMCMNNPQLYYGLVPGTKIVFSLFSAAKGLAASVNWEIFSNIFATSPYFKDQIHLPRGRGVADTGVLITNDIVIDIGSNMKHALGKAVFGALLDEAAFQNEKSGQAQQSYTGLLRRMESRFMNKEGSIPGKLWLASSPKFASDFLADRIEKAKHGKGSLVIDNIPIWEVKDWLKQKETFKVFMGSNTVDPFIVENERVIPIESDHLVLDVPLKYKSSFEKDLMESIKDIAGRRVAGAMNLFKSVEKLNAVMLIPNVISKEIIELDFYDDKDQIHNYIDMEYFKDFNHPESYRFIHLDAAYSANGDRYGIACSYAVPKRNTVYQHNLMVQEVTDRMYYVDFIILIKAKEGQEIPLVKVENFIFFLKNQFNYPIYSISADQFQSKRTLQTFDLAKWKTENVSVDKTRDPYIYLKECINERNILMPNHMFVKNEFLNLRDDGVKIDHPSTGLVTSKDGADGVAGSIWACSRSEVVISTSSITASMMNESPSLSEELNHAQIQNYLEDKRNEMFWNNL